MSTPRTRKTTTRSTVPFGARWNTVAIDLEAVLRRLKVVAAEYTGETPHEASLQRIARDLERVKNDQRRAIDEIPEGWNPPAAPAPTRKFGLTVEEMVGMTVWLEDAEHYVGELGRGDELAIVGVKTVAGKRLLVVERAAAPGYQHFVAKGHISTVPLGNALTSPAPITQP